MAQRLTLDEINEKLKITGKPVKIIAGFTNVHDIATFECSEHHEFDDVVRNIIQRSSIDINSYCPICSGEGHLPPDSKLIQLKDDLELQLKKYYEVDTERTHLLDTITSLRRSIVIIHKEGVIKSRKAIAAVQALRSTERKTARKTSRNKAIAAAKASRKAIAAAKRYHLTIIQDLAAHPSRRWGVMLHDKRLISFQTESECNTWASIHYFEKTGEIWNPDI